MPPPLTRKKSAVFNSFLLATAASVQSHHSRQRRNSDTEEVLVGEGEGGGWLVYRWYTGGGDRVEKAKEEEQAVKALKESKNLLDMATKDLRDPLYDLKFYFPENNFIDKRSGAPRTEKRSLLESS